MSKIVKFEINWRELLDKFNIFNKIQKYLDSKRNLIRQQWFDNVILLTGNNPCNILQNITIKFGVTGYKVVHVSGLEIAYKLYQLPIIHKEPTKFNLNVKNIITLLLKINGVEVDFSNGVVFRTINTEIICGKPIGFVIDYNRSQIGFVFQNSELTRYFTFGIKVCQGVFKVCEKYLVNLLK